MPFVNNRSAAYHWDKIQSMDRVTDDGGIIWYDCVAHGGFGLTKPIYDEMPQHFKNLSFSNDQFFEEHWSFCAVVLWQPFLFKDRPEIVKAAMYAYFDNYHRKASTRLSDGDLFNVIRNIFSCFKFEPVLGSIAARFGK